LGLSKGNPRVSPSRVDAPCATSAAAPACRCRSRADRFWLLARSAGVHVDFHAHLHLNDFRSLPSHWGPPTSVGAVLTPGLNVRRVREQRKCGTRQSSSSVADPTADTSLLDKNHFSLGQSTARYPSRSGTGSICSIRLAAAISTSATALSRRGCSAPSHPGFRLCPDWLR
jgi:hypothetical protein